MTAEAVVRWEENALTGWPALRTELRGGWALRFAFGYSKRANSVHPLYKTSPRDSGERIRECEAAYHRAGLPSTFKLPSHSAWAGLDRALASRGYETVDPSRVLTRDLPPSSSVHRGFHSLETFTEAWHDGFFGANGVALGQRNTARAMAFLVDRPVVGWVEQSGTPMGWGYAAVVGRQAWIYDVVVSPAVRRRGYGRVLVRGLMEEARAKGATQACLQVVATNAQANALYEGLGFTEAYRYHYRRKE